MVGEKATAFHAWADRHQIGFTRFDYRGHGQSDGDPTDLVVSDWVADALTILDTVTRGPVLLIGSSMGAWIATRLIQERPRRIAGLVTVAAAPDFTDRLIRPRLSAEAEAAARRAGFLTLPSGFEPDGYRVPIRLLDDGTANTVLSVPVPFHQPARLLHGLADQDVPWDLSLQLARTLTGADVQITLIKDGDHRLSRPEDLALVERHLAELTGTKRTGAKRTGANRTGAELIGDA